MCEKCNEFDKKTAHYRRMAVHVTDPRTLNGIATLIKEMTTDKAALGCEPARKE